MPSSKKYEELGVASAKEDVHAAVAGVDPGLFPGAFCKLVEDIAGDPAYCTALHADTAGTKGSLAYLYYRETGDVDVFRGVVQDAVVMNTDDLLCVGPPETMLLSNTLGRNKHLVPGPAVAAIIDEYEAFSSRLREYGLPLMTCGGETADVGDVVRTVDVGVTIVARYPRSVIIDPACVRPNDVIVGLASAGTTKYDPTYNSGMGSNGLTLARHGVFQNRYARAYPELYDPALPEHLVYHGRHALDDPLPGTPLTMGQAVLSPTRTYTPVLLDLFRELPPGDVHAIYHNTGGGQTKCLGFGTAIHYIKDAPFPVPPLFTAIQVSSGTPWREMYQVFNMGWRLEVVTPVATASRVISIARRHGVEARVVGHCEAAPAAPGAPVSPTGNHLTLTSPHGTFTYPGK